MFYIVELIVFVLAGLFTFKFLKSWYQRLFRIWPPERNKLARYTFGWLPVVSLIIILHTLRGLASFDVVGSIVYVVFYIVIGYAWIYFGLMLMTYFFDLSWIDDVLGLSNKAALISISGGFLGLTLIYSGANIGDGPGWWCVIFAGGLGLISWILLGLIMNRATQMFERITVERDINCGIRFGAYLLAGGIILARASAGDWTSFSMTVVEFMDGWPVLLLTGLAIIVERSYIQKARIDHDPNHYLLGSSLWGIVYVIFAVVSILLLPPLNENPFYGSILIIIG